MHISDMIITLFISELENVSNLQAELLEWTVCENIQVKSLVSNLWSDANIG